MLNVSEVAVGVAGGVGGRGCGRVVDECAIWDFAQYVYATYARNMFYSNITTHRAGSAEVRAHPAWAFYSFQRSSWLPLPLQHLGCKCFELVYGLTSSAYKVA